LSSRRPASRLATPTPAENGSNGERNSVVLGPNDRLVGQLFIEGDLRVGGTVEGELEATGDIEITGHVNGAVTAYKRLVVGSAGTLIGSDVHVGRLTVEDGATFSGKISMGKPIPKAAKTIEPEPVVEPAPMVEPPPQPIEAVIAKPDKQKSKRR
jgi:cytoskeletal protein CcmA (bactofilin family)